MNRHRAATATVVALLLLIILAGCSVIDSTPDPVCIVGHDFYRDGYVHYICDLYMQEKPHA